MNRMSEFLLKEEFELWLILNAKISPSSAKSYLSYVLGINNIINFEKNGTTKSVFCLFKENYEKGDVDEIKNIEEIIVQNLSIKKADLVFYRSLKTLQNYKSGLFRYTEFLVDKLSYNNGSNFNNNELEKNEYLNISNKQGELISNEYKDQLYLKSELFKVFESRIKTQDRTYEDIFFPIRFITRVFRANEKYEVFKKWVTKLINSIIIHTENGEVGFSQIKKMSIINKRVYINYGGKEYLTYTKLDDDRTLELFDVDSLKQISIDHIKPLYEVMNENKNNLQIIVKITEKLKIYMSEKVSYKKLTEVSRLKELDSFVKSIDTNELLKELELISSETNLQLMDRSYNTSKGKN